MKREDGVLDSVSRKDGVEMRYHVFFRNGQRVVRRVPWHFDKLGDRGWYSGVEGAEMSLDSLKRLIEKA